MTMCSLCVVGLVRSLIRRRPQHAWLYARSLYSLILGQRR